MHERTTQQQRDAAEAGAERSPRPAAPAPAPAAVLQLQRSAGNHAVSRLLQRDETPPAAAPAGGGGGGSQLEADWNNSAYAGSRGKFAGDGRPAGSPKERYLALAPLYRQKGIDRPLKWAHENIVTATFFGRSTPAHKDLKAALDKAEADLRAKGVTERPFRSCWAFNPRTTSTGAWSNHADGRAIDIDAETNPHLTNKNQRKIITLLTGTDIAAATPAGGDGYEIAKEASEAFQANYDPEGMQAKIDELKDEEETLKEEAEWIKAELAGVPAPPPKKKKLTKDEKAAAAANAAKAKAILERLKAKNAEIKASKADQATLAKEKARYEGLEEKTKKLEALIDKSIKEAEDLQAEVEKLEAQMAEDAAKAAEDPPADEKPKARKAREKAVRDKKAKDAKTLKGLKASVKAKQKAAAKAQGQIDPMRRYGEEGFLDLSEELVTALKAAGLSWGGDWKGAKDFMHFDVK